MTAVATSVDTRTEEETFEEGSDIKEIVRLLRHGPDGIENIRKNGSNEQFRLLAEIALSPMVLREQWKRNHTRVLISAYVTPSDEAFALLTMENNVNEWMKEAIHGKNFEGKGTLTRYTSHGRKRDGTKKGWTLEGRKRYNNLYDAVILDRRSDRSQAKEAWLMNEWKMKGEGHSIRREGEEEITSEEIEEIQRRQEEESFVPRNGFVD